MHTQARQRGRDGAAPSHTLQHARRRGSGESKVTEVEVLDCADFQPTRIKIHDFFRDYKLCDGRAAGSGGAGACVPHVSCPVRGLRPLEYTCPPAGAGGGAGPRAGAAMCRAGRSVGRVASCPASSAAAPMPRSILGPLFSQAPLLAHPASPPLPLPETCPWHQLVLPLLLLSASSCCLLPWLCPSRSSSLLVLQPCPCTVRAPPAFLSSQVLHQRSLPAPLYHLRPAPAALV